MDIFDVKEVNLGKYKISGQNGNRKVLEKEVTRTGVICIIDEENNKAIDINDFTEYSIINRNEKGVIINKDLEYEKEVAVDVHDLSMEKKGLMNYIKYKLILNKYAKMQKVDKNINENGEEKVK